MAKKPQQENEVQAAERGRFSLLKLKVLKEKVIVEYNQSNHIGQENFSDSFKYESARFPHPDLKEPLKELKAFVAEIFSLNTVLNLINNPKLKVGDPVQKAGVLAFQDNMDKLEVTGISLSGARDNRAVVITALLTAPSGNKMAINTHCIRFNNESENKYEFLERLQEISDTIENEAYLYVFENKMAQLAMAFDESDQ